MPEVALTRSGPSVCSGTFEVVEEFDGNYLLINMRTTSTASVEWRIEVFELQPNRRYRLLQQTVELRSWPVAMIFLIATKRPSRPNSPVSKHPGRSTLFFSAVAHPPACRLIAWPG